jgi:glycosyltransferase involved in cell wall biosynthesis
MKILFFIGSLWAGGKERRLVELLSYLKENTNYNMLVVLRRKEIAFPSFYKLNIPCRVLTDSFKKGEKKLHFRFYKICKEYKPDIIHTWGSMPAFVSLLAVILQRIPHINSQISDAPIKKKWSIQNIINRTNFNFSTIILANSYAGLKAYKTENRKSRVIYNGINLNRFINLIDKQLIRNKYNLFTSYSVIMVASFYYTKDYDLFIEIAKKINCKRNDVSFLAIGNGMHFERIKKRVLDEQIHNFVFTGEIDFVESLVNIADIGILLSTNGEGISNSILEYMALGKVVIANNLGGTKEIVKHGVNGYLIKNESTEEIADLISNLLDDKEKRLKMGEAGKKLVYESFTIDKMGKEFEKIYKDVTPLI